MILYHPHKSAPVKAYYMKRMTWILDVLVFKDSRECIFHIREEDGEEHYEEVRGERTALSDARAVRNRSPTTGNKHTLNFNALEVRNRTFNARRS